MTTTNGDWPAWATEAVAVVPHDPSWRAAGARACSRLEELLAPWRLGPVEHVGSTAVPGLAAKPIIDLQVPVADPDRVPGLEASLAPHGWHLVPPELDRRPWRRFLVEVVDGRRSAHLHVLTLEGSRWAEQLAFRDALRADADLAARYQARKHELAAVHANDREAYTDGKATFVRQVLAGRADGTT